MSQLPVLVRSEADEGTVRAVVHESDVPAMVTLTAPAGASGEPAGVATDTLTSSDVPDCCVPVMLVVVPVCMTPANALVGASSALPARPPASTTAAAMPVRLRDAPLSPSKVFLPPVDRDHSAPELKTSDSTQALPSGQKLR